MKAVQLYKAMQFEKLGERHKEVILRVRDIRVWNSTKNSNMEYSKMSFSARLSTLLQPSGKLSEPN